jgi:hypothetical protein
VLAAVAGRCGRPHRRGGDGREGQVGECKFEFSHEPITPLPPYWPLPIALQLHVRAPTRLLYSPSTVGPAL